MIRARWFLFSLLLATAVHGDDLAGFQRVFVPFYGTDITGAAGSRFVFAGDSISDAPFHYWPYCGSAAAPSSIGVSPGNLPLSVCPGGTVGRILFVESPAADSVSFGFILRSSAADPAADLYKVSVPFAREKDFRSGTFRIVVPYHGGRTLLRIYEVDGHAGAAVRVTVRGSILGWAPIHPPTELALTTREGSDASYPWLAQLPLDLDCVQLSARYCAEYDAVLEIEPLTAGRYWAIASRTDNVTQAVTLYWPQ